ncbi:hypothetical protein AB9F35_35840, partial [Rhizobium leguminosarum]|uniref:hypothetical protein n=1 Tax=Rhizobium leguminosarum TaxID=384 RepID=UPI003F9DE688
LDDVIAASSSATEEGLARLVPLERITQELVVDEAAAQEAVVKALFGTAAVRKVLLLGTRDQQPGQQSVIAAVACQQRAKGG